MPGPAPRPALRRPAAGRWVGGVATGLAEHLNLDVRLVRAFFAATAVLGGVGAALYVFWWVTIPAPSQSSAPDPWQRLARKLNTGEQNAGDPDPKVKGVGRRSLRLGDVVVALGLLGVAALLFASRMGELRTQGWVVPSLLLVAGGGPCLEPARCAPLRPLQRDAAGGGRSPGGRHRNCRNGDRAAGRATNRAPGRAPISSRGLRGSRWSRPGAGSMVPAFDA